MTWSRLARVNLSAPTRTIAPITGGVGPIRYRLDTCEYLTSQEAAEDDRNVHGISRTTLQKRMRRWAEHGDVPVAELWAAARADR